MKHVLCSNGSCIDGNSSVLKQKLDLSLYRATQTFKFEYLRMLKSHYRHLCLSTLDIWIGRQSFYRPFWGVESYEPGAQVVTTGLFLMVVCSQDMKENLEKALVYANEHSKENQLQYINQYSKKDKHRAYSGWMTCPRVFVRKKNGLLYQS